MENGILFLLSESWQSTTLNSVIENSFKMAGIYPPSVEPLKKHFFDSKIDLIKSLCDETSKERTREELNFHESKIKIGTSNSNSSEITTSISPSSWETNLLAPPSPNYAIISSSDSPPSILVNPEELNNSLSIPSFSPVISSNQSVESIELSSLNQFHLNLNHN